MVSVSKHKWRTFSLCLGGAVVFWLLNALNKVYTTEIDYPVSFITDESKVVLAKVTPTTLRLEVTGSGWRLLRYVLRLHAQPVQLPVSQILGRGRSRNERLCSIFAKKLKDVEVHNVMLDETFYTYQSSSQ